MSQEIKNKTQEIETNITDLTKDISTLTENAQEVTKLAEDYTGFKNALQKTLEQIITITNKLDTENTNTHTEIEKKIAAYENLLIEYKDKIKSLKNKDFVTLSSEIQKIKELLIEDEASKKTRNELLLKAKTIIDKHIGPQPTDQPLPSPPQPPSPQPPSPSKSLQSQSPSQSKSPSSSASQQDSFEKYNKKLNNYIASLPSGTPDALYLAKNKIGTPPKGWTDAKFKDEGQRLDGSERKRTKGGSSKTRRKPKKVRKSRKSRKTRRR